jgi:hypothetical protein
MNNLSHYQNRIYDKLLPKLGKTEPYDELLNWMKPLGEVSRGDICNKAKSLGIRERTLADILRRFTRLNLRRKVTHGVYVAR